MSHVLYITANPKNEAESYSLSVGRAFLDTYRAVNPDDVITELDLYHTTVPLIDRDVFSGWDKMKEGRSFDSLSEDEQSKIAAIHRLTDQFIAADKVVFVTPMWNFNLPAVLKAYIDTVCMADRTFRYTENGPVGLLSGRKAVHIQARGGIYSEGPLADMEFGDRYLRAILSFMGIHETEGIYVEGMGQWPELSERIRQEAMEQAIRTANAF